MTTSALPEGTTPKIERAPTDLLSFDTKAAAEAGYRLILENPFTQVAMDEFYPDGPFYIDILGGDAADVVAVQEEVESARLDRIQRTRSIVPESETKRQEDADILVAATVGWRLPPMGGKELTYSPKAAKDLYLDRRFPWIKEQVNRAVGERKRFFKK